jgi:uncharacterized protein (UPF0332 family)
MSERDELISYRIKQAEESLDTAQFLLANGKDIAAAANRIYYACFYALALLADKKVRTSKHSGIISAFDREFVKKGVFAKDDSQSIHEAFEIRLEYDYREFVSYNLERIKKLLSEIEQFIRRVKEYLWKSAAGTK